MKTEKLTQKLLKKILHYSPDTGIFTWLERPLEMFSSGKRQLNACNVWNSRFSDTEAGNKYKPGKKCKTFYIGVTITLNGKSKAYLAHRLAFLYTDGQLPSEDIDHIDGNGLNNKMDNLRKVSRQENQRNRSMNSNNTSGCTGVSWHKKDKIWVVRIKVKGKQLYGGSFTNKKEAIAKRKQMEIEYNFHKNHGRKTQNI